MKKWIGLILMMIPVVAVSQQKPIHIVFDITSKDSLTHQSVLRHVTGMSTEYPDAALEVVVYGSALPMVMKGKTSLEKDIEKLTQRKNVSFKICGMTMQRNGVEKSQLIGGVQVVPDAILEIVTKQGEGWGYIKESGN